ncbi:MAG: tetratricopeptide repeat protein [Candidatus Latescibacteria bacterium]|nr:tetratricopeptide repeat protein [Candidatus Latescibacterota bacterium]
MRLKRPAVFFILLALFVGALATRSATRDRLDSPYFKGTSAMVYAHALAASEGTPLDTVSIKADHPDGYVPARYRADGFERAWAAAFRAARFVSEVDGRDFARRVVMFLAALCVFTMYALARRLWNCQAAGLVAAFLVAFWSPFVIATNGRTFTHTTLAPFFLSAHAALVVSTLAATSRRGALGRATAAALAAFVLAVSWEPGRYVLAIWSVSLALLARRGHARELLAGQALAVIAACVFSPHLVATRAVGSLATALVVASAVLAWRHPRSAAWRAAALLLGVALSLWVATIPVRAGATEQFPAFSYLVARAAHLFGKPEAAALSDWVRHVWSLDHAPLAPHVAIAVLLPFGLLAAAFVLNTELRERRGLFVASVVVAAVATIATLVDRSILPASALVMAAVVCGGARAPSKSVRVRVPLVGLAVLVMLAGTVFRGGSADVVYQLARKAGVANRDPHSFLWVSFENTDRELVRFVATRTSVRESILAPDDLSALLLAFSGRTVTGLPGATSRMPAEKHVALTRAFYGTEEELFEACRSARINYVVYSIDVLLDTDRYSPRYLAGVTSVDAASMAYRMHFDPESLRRFTLQYENDHYRLFAVTESPQPIFATEHPPFYQTDLLQKANRDVEAFRRLVAEVMLTYAEARKALARGNAEGARRRLEWCLLQAPRYSQARIALADALMNLDRYQDARRVIAALIEYAPDNTSGLYYAAYIDAQLGRPDEAKRYLALLLTIERDPDLIQRARALESFLEQGVMPRPGAPRDG